MSEREKAAMVEGLTALLKAERAHVEALEEDNDALKDVVRILRAHVEALEGALREIADLKTPGGHGFGSKAKSIARAALAGESDD